MLGGDSGYEGSRQLELFKEEMVAVCKGTTLVGKLDLLLCLVLSKRQAQPLDQGFKIQGGTTPYRIKRVLC